MFPNAVTNLKLKTNLVSLDNYSVLWPNFTCLDPFTSENYCLVEDHKVKFQILQLYSLSPCSSLSQKNLCIWVLGESGTRSSAKVEKRII